MILSKFYCLKNLSQSYTLLIRTYNQQFSFRPLNMPRDTKSYLIELQKQRKRMKLQATKYSPSHVYLQVIGNGDKAQPRSLLLCTDHTNYLFNCGEGTQRLATEYHVKLAKVEHIFVTRPVWKNMGGIPGMILTTQETGVPKIYLHGPDGVVDLIEATKNFIALTDLKLEPADISKQFKDHTLSIDYVPIENPRKIDTSELLYDDSNSTMINFYDYHISSNKKRSRSPSNDRDKFKRCHIQINSIMCYVCKLNDKEGTLNPIRCAELGVPTGPILGKLKAGANVILDDGRVVKSKDVCGPSEPGPLFIVIECPDEYWMDAIIENSVLSKHHKSNSNENQMVSYIIHFTPSNILNNSKYKEWMSKFGSETQHLIFNEDNGGISSEAIHRMQYQLNLLHPSIFPLLEIRKSPEEEKIVEIDKNQLKDEYNLQLIYCQTLNSFQLRPNKGNNYTSTNINPKEYLEELLKIEGFSDSITDLQNAINGKSKSLDSFEEYPRLLMLGTGSSIPNKIRNTSGMLLQLDEERSIILDCGEGTLGQLVKFFGKNIDHILRTIKAIYVSHLHADHHLGFIGILKEREQYTDEPVYLLAPQQIVSYLYFYHNRFEYISKLFRLVSNRDLLLNQNILSNVVSNALLNALNVSKIETSFVKHCPFAYGIAITLKDGRKISYSGDAMPCDSFLALARNSFLLIHEATMEDGMEDEAARKSHSTLTQAVNVGVRAEVDFTLLTHFSQRYSKIPLLPDEKESGINFQRVGIAYDFMMINFSKLLLLPLLYPSLSLMFSEFRALLDERATKREFRKERTVNSVTT